MPSRAHGFAFEMHRNVIPMVECAQYFRRCHGIGHLQSGHGGVGKHHTPTEGVIGLVAFQHGDLVIGMPQLHQQTEIQTGGAAP